MKKVQSEFVLHIRFSRVHQRVWRRLDQAVRFNSLFFFQFAARFCSNQQNQREGIQLPIGSQTLVDWRGSGYKGVGVLKRGRLQSKTEKPWALQSFFKMKEIEQKSVGESAEKVLGECIICFDRPPNVTTNSCPHRFCSQCLLKWSKSKRTCPVCRKHYTGIRFSKKIKRYSTPSILPPHQHPSPLFVNYTVAHPALFQYLPPFLPLMGYLPYSFAFSPYYIA